MMSKCSVILARYVLFLLMSHIFVLCMFSSQCYPKWICHLMKSSEIKPLALTTFHCPESSAVKVTRISTTGTLNSPGAYYSRRVCTLGNIRYFGTFASGTYQSQTGEVVIARIMLCIPLREVP